MLKKIVWILLVFLAVTIALLATVPFAFDAKFGILGFKSNELLINKIWRFGFYTHIIFGGIALLIGWLLLIAKIRVKKINLHRNIGKVYVVSVLIASLAGIYLGFYATGGFIASAGFICLGVIWFYTTLTAYFLIRNKRIAEHETMMIYSYTLCFAAVTLRFYLPLSAVLGIDFILAYKFIAWFSWLPNVLVAYLITKRLPFFPN
jgi:uncharacterized membrane protein